MKIKREFHNFLETFKFSLFFFLTSIKNPLKTLTSFAFKLHPKFCLQQIRFCHRVDGTIRIFKDRLAPHFDLNLVRNICLQNKVFNYFQKFFPQFSRQLTGFLSWLFKYSYFCL